MPEETVFDPTDKGTLRPNTKLLRKKGAAFYLVQLPYFDSKIILPEHTSPDNPITLFTLYYTPEIMDLTVEKQINMRGSLRTIHSSTHEQTGSTLFAVENFMSILQYAYI
jgi:hypothetical protein